MDAVSVVGDGDDAGPLQGADGGEGVALHPRGDAAGRQDLDDRVAADGVEDVLDRARVVRAGARVRHADDRGEAAAAAAREPVAIVSLWVWPGSRK